MNRNIVVCIILTIITCGIYGIYWMYKLTEEVGGWSGDRSISPGGAVIFSLITCGIYAVYWCYRMGKQIYQAEMNNGMMASDDSVLFVVLSIFGLGIVVYAILQSRINNLTGVQY